MKLRRTERETLPKEEIKRVHRSGALFLFEGKRRDNLSIHSAAQEICFYSDPEPWGKRIGREI